MSISVLMSLYYKERPEYLRQSLDSVFNQSVIPDEVVLVKDGPLTPELDAVVDEYKTNHKELKVVPLQVNGGLGNALNEGLKHCSHELVARMDTDDICFSNRFEQQIRFMEEHPTVDIISSWLEEFEGDVSQAKSIKRVPGRHEEIAQYIKSRNPLNHPAVMFRKSAVEKSGSYQHFPLFEDYYLWARMMKDGAIFANIQEPLLHFRTSPDMFRRRGGWNYAKDCVKFQWMLHKLGIISSFAAIKSSILRGGVYMMPNAIRAIIYSKVLRN